MASNSSKQQITEQQIIQYILNGGDVQELIKSKNVGWQNVLKAIVKNPDLISSAQQSASSQSKNLNTYDPSVTYSTGKSFDINPITQKYAAMRPEIAKFANDYFRVADASGNNPALVTNLDSKFKEDAVSKYGLDDKTAQALVTSLSEDRDAWMREEQAYRLRNEKANYSAFQKQRAALKLEQGQTPKEKIFSNMLGFGELANLPSKDTTFEQVAKKAAEKAVPVSKDNKSKASMGERYLYEQSFLAMAKKLAGKGGTPYTQTIKKLLPTIAAKKGKI